MTYDKCQEILSFLLFCSDFNLEAMVENTDKIRCLKQLFNPYFLLIGKEIFQNN